MQVERAYGMNSAGHAAIVPRSPIMTSDMQARELKSIWIRWMNFTKQNSWMFRSEYDLACRWVGHLRMSADEVHSVMLQPAISNHDGFDLSGLFLSAVYEKAVTDDIITFPFETSMYRVGWYSSKFIVIEGSDGGPVGCESKGMIIHKGKTTDHLGSDSEGVVINLGIATEMIAMRAKGVVINAGSVVEIGEDSTGIVINTGAAKVVGRYCKGAVINQGRGWTRGRSYHRAGLLLHPWSLLNGRWLPKETLHTIDDLVGMARDDPREIVKAYGDKPAESIKRVLRDQIYGGVQ
jgi:hypothetical protein